MLVVIIHLSIEELNLLASISVDRRVLSPIHIRLALLFVASAQVHDTSDACLRSGIFHQPGSGESATPWSHRV